MIDYLIAFLWGFAEATFFFFIPDIYLSRMAIFAPIKALKACFITAIAACIGGALMYLWAWFDCSAAYYFLTLIPAIFPKLIVEVIQSIAEYPYYALFIAPFKGIPYKIYAVAFGAHKINFFVFIVTSFFARLFRFLLITSIAIALITFLKNYVKEKTIIYLHIFIWWLIYSIYFGSMVFHYM